MRIDFDSFRKYVKHGNGSAIKANPFVSLNDTSDYAFNVAINNTGKEKLVQIDNVSNLNSTFKYVLSSLAKLDVINYNVKMNKSCSHIISRNAANIYDKIFIILKKYQMLMIH